MSLNSATSPIYVQYGCGLSAPARWINFDSSPTLRLQRLPIVGGAFKRRVAFPPNVKYGDITKGLLGLNPNSCDGIYCSHVLEHLALKDFRIALKNTLTLLKPGAIFRCVVPDLEFAARQYLETLTKDPGNASHQFFAETLLGMEERPRGTREWIISALGNSNHLWMWDVYSLKKELQDAGFQNVRAAQFNDSRDKAFLDVEDSDRFVHAAACEAFK